LALSPTPPTALRTASSGVLPPLEPLLEPFELGAFAFELADLELDDFGFARFAVFGFVDLDFVDFTDFDFEAALGLAFDFDCDFGFDFALVDEPALFGADRFLGLVSAIFLSPRGFPIRSGTQSIEGKSR
jgi:hypothetical protein